MKSARVLEAMKIPPESLVDQRIPKKMLLELGAVTATDRQMIRDNIESIVWVAALKPANLGVPVYRDKQREYLEIAVITLTLRGKCKGTRIVELVHRAVPYPVALIVEMEIGFLLSFAHKRCSQGEAGKVVVEEFYQTPIFQPTAPTKTEEDFLATLAIPCLAQTNLYALYQGWINCTLGLEAAQITGNYYRIQPADNSVVDEEIAAYKALERETEGLRLKARKEKQINRRLDMNLEIKKRENEMKKISEKLNRMVPESANAEMKIGELV